MKTLDEIKKLRNNSDAIYQLFNVKIPLWKTDPKHYDKTGWEFNGDSRFNACKPATIGFSSFKGVYGDSGCTAQLDLDPSLFQQHLIIYLNKNKEEVMKAIAKSIKEVAKSLKSDAEQELNSELEKLKQLDII